MFHSRKYLFERFNFLNEKNGFWVQLSQYRNWTEINPEGKCLHYSPNNVFPPKICLYCVCLAITLCLSFPCKHLGSVTFLLGGVF